MIRARAAEEPELGGMGTTCVVAAVTGLQLTVAHAGDSRAYRVTARGIERLTRDHSLAEEILCTVGVKAATASQNVLTRSLGQKDALQVEVTEPLGLDEGTIVVLCSDGLTKIVQDDEICDTVLNYGPGIACRNLIRLARQRGGPDNITVEVARVEAV
jgi:protein phosphatase